MTVGQKGLDLIKSFEGCKLKAYKPVATEKFFTIGYGHYGSDVKEGMTITKAQAEKYLIADCQKFANAVDKLKLSLNSNQRDALISFAYNCGEGNLKKLVAGRSLSQIADAFLLYTKAGGKVLKGLERRRKAERELYLSTDGLKAENKTSAKPQPYPTVRYGMFNDTVGMLQSILIEKGYNIGKRDSIFGSKTERALKDWQGKNKDASGKALKPDGICGPKTWESLLR